MNKMMINNQVVLSKVSVIWCLLFLREIEGKNCNFNVQVEQKLLNEGFHRNLSINIDFASDNEEERWLYEDCMVGIEQTLPAGVYASPDEINDNGCKNLIHAIFKTPVNTELPAQKSEPLIIHLLSKVRDYRTHVYIPVHARYHHAAAGGGTVRNEIPVPKLYLMCPDKKLNRCDNLYLQVTRDNNFCVKEVSKEICSWKEIPTIVVTTPITWDVAIGNTDHYLIVTSGTVTVIIAGSLYLLNAIHQHKTQMHRNKKKF
ncbi:phosphatidylinositol-glycan biosynthesis class X protein isoform X1 [Maniola hyperantus]|uniref:phosphatidylinositol-glycan biosynthesis class X protein isoform X1 n=1 Tax=Aphantopus hyperantus TaxID=2795564 RepID=UPI00156954D5|nr:uncharacterized protein LOC117988787 isoform X2 [Maniola hyperantus]